MSDHDLTTPEDVGGGDLLVMDSIGGNHDRPNERRLVGRHSAGGGVLLIEQMNKDGTWVDVGTVASASGNYSPGVRLRVGPQAKARD